MINTTEAREARRVVRRVARIQAIRQAPLLNKAHDQHVDGLRSTAAIYEDRINYAALLAAKAALRAATAARGAKLRPSTRPSSSASGSRQCPPLPRIWPLSMVASLPSSFGPPSRSCSRPRPPKR